MKPASLIGGCIGFGDIKAPLVLSQPVGAFVQTRRMIKAAADRALLAYDSVVHKAEFARPGNGWTDRVIVMPRYREGKVYRVGIPHWGRADESTIIVQRGNQWFISVDGTFKRTRPHPPTAEALKQQGWQRRSSYCLPSWAATQWLKCLSAEPQRLSQMTEADAVEELVELLHGAGEEGHWKNYEIPQFMCDTALESFLTMLAAVLKRDVWDADPWFWAYRFEVVEKPEESR